MKIYIRNHNHHYAIRHLAMQFVPRDHLLVSNDSVNTQAALYITSEVLFLQTGSQVITALYQAGKRQFYAADTLDESVEQTIKAHVIRQLYRALVHYYQRQLPWGILVGVRPTKLCFSMYQQGFTNNEIRRILKEQYYIRDDKIDLLLRITQAEKRYLLPQKKRRIAMYISIPFCPSRCIYCSFPSNAAQRGDDLIKDYLEALIKEIKDSASLYYGQFIDTLYIGGGTPALLTADQVKQLFSVINQHYNLSNLREFSFEAGRPELIDQQLLTTLVEIGVNRICINPQTLKNATLKAIGRRHDAAAVLKAIKLSQQYPLMVINADMILGLPGEDSRDVIATVDQLIALGVDNVTVHTLAIKNASQLNNDLTMRQMLSDSDIEAQLESVSQHLLGANYQPYYMYRQKYIMGNLENVGYTKADKACLYNMQIIEENQSIVGFGAGASSKILLSDNHTLKRVHNVKDLKQYILRFSEMVARKKAVLLDYLADHGKEY